MQTPEFDEATVDMRILKQLDHLEKLLWTGMPPSSTTPRPTDALAALGPVLFVAFIVKTGIPFPPWLWLLPVGLIGSYGLARFERSNTVYGLTDRQVIIIGRILGQHEICLKLAELADVTLDERSNGSATIRFGGQRAGWRNQTWISDLVPSTDKTPPKVEVGPGEARKVFALFEQARQAARLKARS
jgi:hypothetical protein